MCSPGLKNKLWKTRKSLQGLRRTIRPQKVYFDRTFLQKEQLARMLNKKSNCSRAQFVENSIYLGAITQISFASTNLFTNSDQYRDTGHKTPSASCYIANNNSNTKMINRPIKSRNFQTKLLLQVINWAEAKKRQNKVPTDTI